jgi:phage tail sheath gpL-like
MASPNVSFSSIPSSIRKPGKYFEFNTALAVRTLAGNQQKVLMVGQRLASGSIVANTPVDVFSDVDAATYFGRGSIAHLMVRAALQANNYVALTVITLDDAAAAVAATTAGADPEVARGERECMVRAEPESAAKAKSDLGVPAFSPMRRSPC